MNKPESTESVWPHTEMVLFFMDSDTCFGEPVEESMEDVLDCEHIGNNGEHVGNELSANAQTLPPDKIEQEDEIIPHSLILVHCDLILDTKMEVYLNGLTIPKASRVVAIIDDSEYQNPVEELDTIRFPIEKAYSKEDLLEEAREYFRIICPSCSGQAARKWVHSWCEGVYHRVEN